MYIMKKNVLIILVAFKYPCDHFMYYFYEIIHTEKAVLLKHNRVQLKPATENNRGANITINCTNILGRKGAIPPNGLIAVNLKGLLSDLADLNPEVDESSTQDQK